MNNLFLPKNRWLYFIWLVSIVLLIGELLNHRFAMHDLEVYYRTANRMVHHQALYRIQSDGHYVYKYAPTAATYFIPLLILPFTAAKVIYWFLLTGITAYILHLLFAMLAEEPGLEASKLWNKVLLLSFLAGAAHFHREWHLGQVNLILLFSYVLITRSLIKNQPVMGGFLLGFSLYLKPFGLIFLPYFIFRNKYKHLLYSLVFLFVFGLIPFIFYPSGPAFKQLYLGWFNELAIEMKMKQDLLAAGNHTIFSVLARYSPLKLMLTNAQAIKIYQLIVLGIIAGSFLLFIKLSRKRLPNYYVAEMAFLIAFIPMLAFTSYNAFLFATPCMVILLYNARHFSGGEKILLTLALILIGGNIRDLVGAKNFALLDGYSVYTFGSILLLLLLFSLRKKQLRHREQIQIAPSETSV